ncbi:MATE family efflux transporter [Dokdonia pacifica]|uniref:Multidrug-efflux transporter n=1 Tax=Dokdonia pacifica TaxID=1627892 RepID=A0A238WEI6_9FLAO|nr:MATE family efflux transporter [Dokdonia pacifica]GGG13146.1 MATE family efflux transporter [Dokdonia pacifica]SNR44079.1 putative efflux protein, MATE family [Dokdonia pacifica]
MAIPAIIAGIAEPILSSTDAAIVGNMDTYSTESLAAVGIVGAFLSMLIWILGQTRSAISTIISQNLGAGKLEDIKVLPAQAIFFNILLSFVFLGGTYFFVDEIFTFLNAEGMVLDLSIDYYNIRVWGFPLTLFTFAIFGIFRGLQNTFWPMLVAIAGALINIGLDIILVYGVEGMIDPMGVKGAAWASLLSQAVMAIMALIFLLVKTNVSLRLRFPLHPEINRLVSMSLNLFARSFSLNVALVIAVKEATALGTANIAAHTIAVNIWLFTAFFIDGYGAAGNLLSGRLLGAKDYKKLWILTKRVNTYNLFVAGLLMIACTVGYTFAGELFTNEDIVLKAFYSVFFIVILIQPLNSIAFTLDAIFKGLGEMAYLRNTLLGATFLGFVPMVYFGKWMHWELKGIWYAFVVWMVFRASALCIKYYNSYYKLAKNA